MDWIRLAAGAALRRHGALLLTSNPSIEPSVHALYTGRTFKRTMAWMAEFSYRGFPISIFIRRQRDVWEVTTTIYAPKDLVGELSDEVIMDSVRLPTNRIEEVRRQAHEQAKKFIDDLVARRAKISQAAS
jgi:hypothetical protein